MHGIPVLSHNSSLALLRSVPPQTGLLTPTSEAIRTESLTPSARDLSVCDADRLGIARPLHVLTAGSRPPLRIEGVTSHGISAQEIPAGLLWSYDTGPRTDMTGPHTDPPALLTCGPELTFIQMTTRLNLAGRVVLGHELCGTYSQFARMISGYYERPALTTRADIERATRLMTGMRGVTMARQALKWVREGARSPMETIVSCMLFLPPSEGGYGFAQPTLNYEVPLDARARAITQTSTCYVDAAWPNLKLGIEYDSSAWHHDPDKDRRRREALTHMGWTIYTLQLDDMRGFAALDRMVSLFAERVPRARGNGSASASAKDRLLKRLFTLTRCGLGLEAALFGVPVARDSVQTYL